MALKDAAAYALVGRITRAAAGKGHARIGLAQLYLLLLSCAAVLSVGMFRGTGPAARARVEEDALVEIASVGR